MATDFAVAKAARPEHSLVRPVVVEAVQARDKSLTDRTVFTQQIRLAWLLLTRRSTRDYSASSRLASRSFPENSPLGSGAGTISKWPRTAELVKSLNDKGPPF
jgi:hypothetical protein